jgi:hypothetical protein
MKVEYKEIKALKDYCDKIGVIATLEYSPQYFGYMIMFKNGSDCFQRASFYDNENNIVVYRFQRDIFYDNENNIVEFGNTGSRIDFKATTLKNAKAFVKRNKDKLNKEERNERN